MDKRLELRIKQSDYDKIKKEADKLSLSVSAYIRLKALGNLK